MANTAAPQSATFGQLAAQAVPNTRSLTLDPPIEFYRESMVSATNGSYKATLIDQEGKTWSTRIMGMKIFWKHFTLDHYLEEDDVVVFELTDPRPESVTFLVHIFRVVDVKVTLTGKEGWAIHYNVVEGTKKQYFEERRRLRKAQEQKKLRKQNKSKTRKDLGSGITGYFRRKKNNSERSPKSQHGKSKRVQEEEHALEELEQQQHQALRSFRRPTTRLRRQEINQSSGELNNITTPSSRRQEINQSSTPSSKSKSDAGCVKLISGELNNSTTPSSKSKSDAGCVKQEIEEEAPPLAAASVVINLMQGNSAVNFVTSTEPSCVLKEVFAGEGLSH